VLVRRIAFSSLLLLGLGVGLAAAAGRVGTEWRISVNDTPRNRYPVAALDGHGGALVVWANTRIGIMGRQVSLADPNAASGPEMRLLANTNLPSIPGEGIVLAHKEPALLYEADGSFWVFWTRERSYLKSVPFHDTRTLLTQDIRAAHFDANGQQINGRTLVVGQGAPGFQSKARVLRTATGTIAVVWQSDDQNTATTVGDGVFARFLDASGNPLGRPFRVNPTVGDLSANPALASDAQGNVLIVWDANDGSGPGVYGRLYSAQGEALGAAQRISTSTVGRQNRPSAAFIEGQGYMVLWQGATGERFRTRIYGQRLDTAGQKIGGQIEISHGALEYEYDPSLVATPRGTYMAAWMLWDSSFPRAVRGRELNADGTPFSDEINISTSRVDAQYRTSLATHPVDGALAVWEGFPNHHAGITAQRID
jgi:hypothetical protein